MLGGGCYGCDHARHVRKAMERARLRSHALAEWLGTSLHRLRPDLQVRSGPLSGSSPVPDDVTVQQRPSLSEGARRCLVVEAA